jgi:hypothetical protein
VTEIEAFQVVGMILAGYPSAEWGEPTIALWVDELRPLGAREGMAAARSMIRTHRFPSVAAYMDALAVVRERHMETSRDQNLQAKALESGERWLTPAESAARFRQLAASRRALKSRWRVALEPHRTAPWHLRPDQTYFYPPPPTKEQPTA